MKTVRAKLCMPDHHLPHEVKKFYVKEGAVTEVDGNIIRIQTTGSDWVGLQHWVMPEGADVETGDTITFGNPEPTITIGGTEPTITIGGTDINDSQTMWTTAAGWTVTDQTNTSNGDNIERSNPWVWVQESGENGSGDLSNGGTTDSGVSESALSATSVPDMRGRDQVQSRLDQYHSRETFSIRYAERTNRPRN